MRAHVRSHVRLRAYAGHGYACDDETRGVGAGRDRLFVQGRPQARVGVFGSGVAFEGFTSFSCYVCVCICAEVVEMRVLV